MSSSHTTGDDPVPQSVYRHFRRALLGGDYGRVASVVDAPLLNRSLSASAEEPDDAHAMRSARASASSCVRAVTATVAPAAARALLRPWSDSATGAGDDGDLPVQ